MGKGMHFMGYCWFCSIPGYVFIELRKSLNGEKTRLRKKFGNVLRRPRRLWRLRCWRK